MTAFARYLELETLRLEQDGRVLIARVDNPPYNFMTAQMQRDLDRLTRAVDEDRSIGAVILTGAPPDRYITHFDIGDILEAAERVGRPVSERVVRTVMRGVEAAQRIRGAGSVIEGGPIGGIYKVSRFNEVVLRIMRSPAVYIGAINGPCGGGGCEMSVCLDVRLAADDATFILPELLIGLTTTIGAQRLTQLIGPARALEFMLEGRAYTAKEALDWGLVNRVMPRNRLVDAACELAARYATRPRPTIAAQKRIFNEYSLFPPAESLRREGATNASGVTSGPAPRALRAWVRMQRKLGGESAFLANLEPWVRGEVVDLNADT